MHLGEHHELQHHNFRLRFTELNEIYIFQSLRSLAFTFIAHFIPIYLYLTYNDIKVVFIYYAISYGVKGLLEPLVTYLIERFGPKHIIASSVPFSLLFLFMMQTLENYNWSVYLISLVVAIMLSLFWQAYHYDFSRAKRKNKATSDVTTQYVILYSLAIVTPFLGGFLMDESGPMTVFGIALGLMLLGTMALFKTSDNHNNFMKIDLKKLNWKCVRKDMLSFTGYSIESMITMAVWPLFIYLIVGDYKTVGAVTSFSLLISTIIMYYVGKKSDKNNDKKINYIKYGAISSGFINLFRVFVETVAGVYFINLFKAISSSFFITPWISEYYLHADEEARSEYMLVMETSADFSRAAISILFIILAFFVTVKFLLVAGLVVGGLGAFLSASMPPARCEVRLDRKDFKVMPQPARRGLK